MSDRSSSSQPDISLLINSLRGGGAERVMVMIANELARRGFRTHLVLGRDHGAYSQHISPNVTVVDLHTNRTLQATMALARYLRNTRPPVLLSASVMCNIAALALGRFASPRTRIVIREDSFMSLASPITNRTPSSVSGVSTLAFRAVPRLYPKADLIITASKGSAADLVENFGARKVKTKTIYNPVISDGVLQESNATPSHPWCQDTMPVVLAVGRLSAEKDFSTLLRAFALVRQQRESRLLILGEGPDRVALEALSTTLGISADVDMPGFVDNPYSFMKHSAVYVLSSVREGMSNTLVEAMACGCPVVSTDCPSGPSELLDGGRYGALVRMGSSDELAESILDVLSGGGGRPTAEWLRQFTVEYAVDRYVEVLGIHRK